MFSTKINKGVLTLIFSNENFLFQFGLDEKDVPDASQESGTIDLSSDGIRVYIRYKPTSLSFELSSGAKSMVVTIPNTPEIMESLRLELDVVRH